MHFQTNSKDTDILHSSLVTAYPLCHYRKFILCFLMLVFHVLMTTTSWFAFEEVEVCIIAVNNNILFSIL